MIIIGPSVHEMFLWFFSVRPLKICSPPPPAELASPPEGLNFFPEASAPSAPELPTTTTTTSSIGM